MRTTKTMCFVSFAVRQLLSILLSFTLTLSQGFYPALVLAQEATESAIEATVSTEVQPEASLTPSLETGLSPTVSPLPSFPLLASPSPDPTPGTSVVSHTSFTGSQKVKKDDFPTWAEGEILVKFDSEKLNLSNSAGQERALEFVRSQGLSLRENLKYSNISVLKTKNDAAVPAKIEELKKDSRVVFAERNYKRKPSVITSNDPRKGDLWGLYNSGQTINSKVGTFDADIDAPEAWDISEGSGNTVVAVIDTGVAYNHPDLVGAMWNGSACKDESGAALGGCIYGYDFGREDKDPLPSKVEFGGVASHGTHIAGTIAASKNNSKGIVGVAPGVKIMALKVDFYIDSLVRAIDFARVNGAKIINASYGGPNYSQAEREAIQRFAQAGGLFVTAAGNFHINNDTVTDYPSKYPLENIISVAATDNQDKLADFSNYGAQSVDVGAPGVDILSTVASFRNTDLLFETFEELASGSALPRDWAASSGSKWNVFATGDPDWGKVLYGDTRFPYSANQSTVVTLPKVNMKDADSGTLSFYARCDTEYDSDDWNDYMTVEFSSDGNEFDLVSRFDEFSLDSDTDGTDPPQAQWITMPLVQSELTEDFQARFGWTTNREDNNYEGCLVDDVIITKGELVEGEEYEFWNGTSMATPHVVGTAALVWSAKQNLTASQVKSIVLSTGDSLASLAGKTLTGKRVNATRALQAVKGPGILGVADDPSPVKSKTWSWYSDDATAQFRFAVDQNSTWTPVGAFGVVRTASVASGDGRYYLHVQAKANGVESEVFTVYAVLDNTSPSVSQLPISGTPISAPVGIPISSPISSPTDNTGQTIVWELVGDISGVAHYVIEIVEEATNQTTAIVSTMSNQVDLFWDFFITLIDGVWNIFVTAEDSAGNTASVLSQTVVIDTLAPTGRMTKPLEGSYLNRLPDLGVEVGDASGSGVQYVNFWFLKPEQSFPSGGGTVASGSGIIATDYTAPYEATASDWASFEDFQVSPAPEGLYSVWAEIVDNHGNAGVTPRVGFTYDRTVPSAPEVRQPAASVTVDANTYTVSGVKEAGSKVKLYAGENVMAEEASASSSFQNTTRGGGGAQTPICAWDVRGGGPEPGSWSINVALGQNTANNFTATSTDCAGNESGRTIVPTIAEDSIRPAIVSYTLDNAVISPRVTPGVKDTASFDLAFSEQVSADFDILDSSGLKIRDIYAATVTNPQAKTWDGKNNAGAFVADGVYTIKIAITDAAGTTFVDTAKTITVDNALLSLSPIGARRVNEGEELRITVVGSDEEGNSLTYDAVGAPVGALFNMNSGHFIWLPAESQGPGVYNVTFTVTNGSETKSEIVTITVTEVNQAPIASNVAVVANEDLPVEFTLVASDNDLPANSLAFALVSTPLNGTLSALAGNRVTYTPRLNFNGADSFVFKVNDGTVDAQGVVSITVNPVNDPPTAVDETISTFKNTKIVVPVLTLLVNDFDLEGGQLLFVTAAGAKNGTVSVNGTNVEFTPTTDFVGLGSFVYAISDGTDTGAGLVTVVVNPVLDEPDEVILTPIVNVESTKPNIVVGPAISPAIVNVPTNITNAVLDLVSLAQTVGAQVVATIPADITLNVASSAGNIVVGMPQDITVTAPATWNGKITAPKLESTTAVTIPASANTTTATTAVIEVGAGNVGLSFDKAVRIVIPGQAGKLAAWVRSGVITQISNTCSADSQVTGNALVADGECKIDSGSDLVIWTKHFTQFVAYTQTTATQTTSSASSDSSSGASAPVCNDTKPVSAPKLVNAKVTGNGEVTLTWLPAADPVTYYLVAYGAKPGEIKYGNPNVGGKDTTSYTVRGLGGGTYYFRVRAGNGCTPGDFSNELASSLGGIQLTAGEQQAEGFTEGVLGKTTDDEAQEGRTGDVKASEKTENNAENIISKVASNQFAWAVAGLVFGVAAVYLIFRRRG